MNNFEERVLNDIFRISDMMIEYQKQNDVKNQCITNCVYLMDTINSSFRSKILKLKAVYACWFQTDKNAFISCRHMVLEVVGTKIRVDPSYDVIKNEPTYFENIKEYKDSIGNDKRCNFKKVCEDWIQFIKIADGFNDDKIYQSQVSYIEYLKDSMCS